MTFSLSAYQISKDLILRLYSSLKHSVAFALSRNIHLKVSSLNSFFEVPEPFFGTVVVNSSLFLYIECNGSITMCSS